MTAVGCDLRMPNMAHFERFIRTNAKRTKGKMLRAGSRAGQKVVICGAGPSLRDALPALRELLGKPNSPTELWACNSALPYLRGEGVAVTHALTIDQGEEMLRPEEFGQIVPRVTYLLSTATHPNLSAFLRRANARIRWFHSFCGVPNPDGWAGEYPYETTLYQTLFEPSVQVGHGLNSVPRAVCLAMGLGFADIAVYGADCACVPDSAPMPDPNTGEDVYDAWLAGLVFYADGRTASVFGRTPMAEAVIDGRRWHTRPDMVVSAVHLLELVQASNGRVRLLGDTLPNTIASQGPGFLEQMPWLDNDIGRVVNFGAAA
jgi:hypothetical protein